MDKSGVRNGRPSLFRWGDAVVILAVLLLAGASFFLLIAGSRPGASAVITTPEGEITWELSRDHAGGRCGRGGSRPGWDSRGHRGGGRADSLLFQRLSRSNLRPQRLAVPGGAIRRLYSRRHRPEDHRRQRRGRGHDDRLRRNRRA